MSEKNREKLNPEGDSEQVINEILIKAGVTDDDNKQIADEILIEAGVIDDDSKQLAEEKKDSNVLADLSEDDFKYLVAILNSKQQIAAKIGELEMRKTGFIKEFEKAITEQDTFENRLKEKYNLTQGMNYVIDFNTKQILKK